MLGLFRPGTHGSTFGANPLACAIGQAALDVIIKEKLPAKAAQIGEYFKTGLARLKHQKIKEVRGKGLLLALEFSSKARPFCEILLKNGVLAKDTHHSTVRFAPPLIITSRQIDQVLDLIEQALAEF